MSQGAQNNHPEAIEVHMVAYYYAALTNLFCQVCLSPIQQGGDNYAVRARGSGRVERPGQGLDNDLEKSQNTG